MNSGKNQKLCFFVNYNKTSEVFKASEVKKYDRKFYLINFNILLDFSIKDFNSFPVKVFCSNNANSWI